VVDDGHTESLGSACDGAADAAKTDDAEGLAVEGVTEVVHEAERFAGVVAQATVEFGGAACDGKHKGESEFGGRFDDRVGGVGDEDVSLTAGLEVDIVVAYGIVGYQTEVGHAKKDSLCDGKIEAGDENFDMGEVVVHREELVAD